MDFRVAFDHADAHNAFARIRIDDTNKIALVIFGREFDDPTDVALFDPEAHGKHEALHLFISKLTNAGLRRETQESELDRIEEGMVRVLERLL